MITGAAAAGRGFFEVGALKQIVDVAQDGVLGAFGYCRALVADEFVVAAVNQFVQKFNLSVYLWAWRSVVLLTDLFCHRYSCGHCRVYSP